MISLIASTLIERPVKQVFDFVSTPENDYQWQYGTLATARLPQGSGVMQTFFRSIGHLMGRRNLSTFEITEFAPNQKYSFKSLSGPLYSKTSYALENVSGRTRIDVSIQASAPDFLYITEKLLWKTMKIQLEEDINKLKIVLEENSFASGQHQDDIPNNNEPDVMGIASGPQNNRGNVLWTRPNNQ